MMLGDCIFYGEKFKMLFVWFEMKKFKNKCLILLEFFKVFISDVERILDVFVKYIGNEIRDYMKVVLDEGIDYFFYYDVVFFVMFILEKFVEVKDLIDRVKKLEEVYV